MCYLMLSVRRFLTKRPKSLESRGAKKMKTQNGVVYNGPVTRNVLVELACRAKMGDRDLCKTMIGSILKGDMSSYSATKCISSLVGVTKGAVGYWLQCAAAGRPVHSRSSVAKIAAALGMSGRIGWKHTAPAVKTSSPAVNPDMFNPLWWAKYPMQDRRRAFHAIVESGKVASKVKRLTALRAQVAALETELKG